MWAARPAAPPLPPSAPVAPVCPAPPVCDSRAAVVGKKHERPALVHAAAPAKACGAALPPLETEPDPPPDALRAWFAGHAAELGECSVPGAEPRPPRRLLLTIHLTADGAVRTLELAGGRELARDELTCIRARVSQLRFPLAELHGRETVVVSIVL